GTDGTVTQIDPKTDRVVARIHVAPGASPPPVFWVAVGAAGVWATSGETIVRIDPSSGGVVARQDIYSFPTGLAVPKDVWVTTEDQQLVRFSYGEYGQSTDLRASGLAPTTGAGSVWVIAYEGQGVVQPYDLISLELGPGIPTSAFPLDVAVRGKTLWAVDVNGTVLRIDAAAAQVTATVPTGPTLRSSIAVGAGAVWITNEGT